MQQDKFKNVSTEELIKKEKTLKIITGMFIGILLVLLISSVYLSVKNNEFDITIIVAIALLGILPMNIMNIKNLRKEINARNE